MNNQLQFVSLWCCVPLDFVVQINNFFWLVLFSAVIHKGRGKKLISKTIKYKLCRSSKMQFSFFFILKIFTKFFGNDANSRGRRGYVLCVIMTQCVQKSLCDSSLKEEQISTTYRYMPLNWNDFKRNRYTYAGLILTLYFEHISINN